MRATRPLLAAAFLAAALSSLSASTPPPVTLPDWMEQAAAQPKGSYPDDTDAVVLLDETSIRVM